jgi:hypothetical protein
MNTELKARLDALSERLKERGVVDVKFHVDKSGNPSADKVASDAADFIEAILDGKTKPCFGIGDSDNPVHNLKEQEAVTESGTGGRSSRTMTAAHRSYDELDFGVISEATVDSSEVAVSTSTSASPNIITLSGETRDYNKETDGIGTIMSTSANASPCALNDDQRVRLASNC